jgi:hypothetical protein
MFKLTIQAQLKIHKALAVSLPVIERANVIKAIDAQYFWNLTTPGIIQLESGKTIQDLAGTPLQRAKNAIAFICDYNDTGLFILENIPELIASQANAPEQEELIAHLINTACSLLNQDDKFMVILDIHEIGLPETLRSLIPSFTYPLPCAREIGELLPQNTPELQLICAGLTVEEIKTGLRRITQVAERHRSQDDDPATVLLDYKIERLKALGLDFIPKPTIGEFGGLDRIKTGIEQVRVEFMEVARNYNIPYPKGWLLAGVPGTGKTFCSQICAAKLGFPLISVGADVVKGGGAAFLKRLLTRIEACSPAVCFFDEFDKFFAADSTSGEDKQSKQILGILLTWLQEKRTPTFVIATLNRLDALPPELTRAGRFDKIFYVGFPQSNERKEIFQLHASRFDPRFQSDETCPLTHSDWMILLGKTQNCTGAEIRAIVEGAAREVFHRLYQDIGSDLEYHDSLPPIELSLEQLLHSRSEITSLFSRDPERVLAMENRAKYVAVEASSPDTSSFAPPLTSYWGD